MKAKVIDGVNLLIVLAVGVAASPLITIWFISSRKVVKSQKRYKSGEIDKTIFARKCTIQPIEQKQTAARFLRKNHKFGIFIVIFLLWSMRRQKIFGLFYEEKLVYIMCFKKKKGFYDMYAMCGIKNAVVVGGTGKLLKHFYTIHPQPIKTLSLKNAGSVYEKLGFKVDGEYSLFEFFFKRKTGNKKLFTKWVLDTEKIAA